MGISIKHDEYERLIRQLADERGLSLTEAVGTAVRNELDRSTRSAARNSFMDRIRRAQAIVAAAPVLDPRPYRDILYDKDGLPR